MVTINFNFSADTAQSKDLATAFTLPSPEYSSDEKKGNSGIVPSPQAADARLANENEAVPSPVSTLSASTQTALPKPTDRGITEKADNYTLPTPITASEDGLPLPPALGTLAAPRPTEDVAGTKKTKQDRVPTPNDYTSLAKEVNEAIDKGEKKLSRSKSTRNRATTKKK